MKSFYSVSLSYAGGAHRDSCFTYGVLTDLQEALEFEFWTDLRENGGQCQLLSCYEDVPLTTFVRGRATGSVDLLSLVTLHGPDGVAFAPREVEETDDHPPGQPRYLIREGVTVGGAYLASARRHIDWSAVSVLPPGEPLLAAGEHGVEDGEEEGRPHGLSDAFVDSNEDLDAAFRAALDAALAVDPGWLSADNGAVRAVAESMRAANDYGAMPVLADALQEAGCDNELMLWHCRSPAVAHAHGSWLVERLRRA